MSYNVDPHDLLTLVTNVDSAFLVMGLDGDFNLRRLERYIALAKSAGVLPVVVLTKADLCTYVDNQLDSVSRRLPPSIERYALNATDPTTVECLAPYLGPGQTAVLLGSSGVGKSGLRGLRLDVDKLALDASFEPTRWRVRQLRPRSNRNNARCVPCRRNADDDVTTLCHSQLNWPHPMLSGISNLSHSPTMTSTSHGTMNLDTVRLHLRQPVEQDAEAIIAIASNWDVARRLARLPHPYTATDVRFFFDHVVPNEHTWAIVLRGTVSLIGIIGLAPASDGLSAELGYYIAPDHWGRGFATEAARTISEVGFKSFDYRKLTSGYYMDNPASGRVLAKIGFTIIGTSNRPCLAEGKNKAALEVELLQSSFRNSIGNQEGIHGAD